MNVYWRHGASRTRAREDLADALEVHFLELPKFNKEKPGQLSSPFERWLQVLKFGTRFSHDHRLPAELMTEKGTKLAIFGMQK